MRAARCTHSPVQQPEALVALRVAQQLREVRAAAQRVAVQ
jgi:hypothetical protein